MMIVKRNVKMNLSDVAQMVSPLKHLEMTHVVWSLMDVAQMDLHQKLQDKIVQKDVNLHNLDVVMTKM